MLRRLDDLGARRLEFLARPGGHRAEAGEPHQRVTVGELSLSTENVLVPAPLSRGVQKALPLA